MREHRYDIMASKYDLHWVRVKAGQYRLSNGNYEVIKKGTEWNVYWYDLWNGKKTLIHVADTCADGKSYAIRHHDKMQKDAIKRLGR